MTDSIREDMEATIRELEGKEETVVETAAKLEPEVKDPEPVVEEGKEPEAKEPEEEGKEPEAKEPVEEEKTDPLLVQDKAPSGWTPKVREQWATIPKDVRDEILRREDASAQGVRKLQEETAPMRGFVQQLDPFIKEAINNGANPAQYIGNVMAAERALRAPSQDDRFAALLNIADQYGIPLREVINASVGREVLQKAAPSQPSVPPEIQRELEESRKWREQQSMESTNREIAAFKSGKEFFDDVAPYMANLMEAGAATTLQDAYDQAIWAVPTVREVLLGRQGKTNATNDLKEKQKAAAAAGIKSNDTIGVKTKKKDGEDESSLADDIREAFAAQAGRT